MQFRLPPPKTFWIIKMKHGRLLYASQIELYVAWHKYDEQLWLKEPVPGGKNTAFFLIHSIDYIPIIRALEHTE